MKRLVAAALLALLPQDAPPARGAAPTLSVVPAAVWRASGTRGGPFATDPRTYVLRAIGSEGVAWTARASEPWLALSATDGRLARGAQAGVAVALAPGPCAELAEGVHRARLEFATVGASDPIVREVELRVLARRGLRVAPEAALEIDGTPAPGASAPPGGTFTIANAGASAIEWRARSSEAWLRLAPPEGTLAPGARLDVRAEVDAGDQGLPPGQHRARVEFENATDGTGSTGRDVVVLVRGLRGLSVRPAETTRARIDEGSDGAEVARYELANDGEHEIRFEVRSSEPWLAVEPASGVLAPKATASAVVRASVADRARPSGGTRAALAFVNRTDGVGTSSRWIEVEGDPPAADAGATELAASVSRFGITWTFDRAYPVGRFVNGDPWVVGPALVVAVDPPSRRAENRTTNGSMVDPSPRAGLTQGYDSAMYGKYADRNSFDAKLDVAAGLAAWQPLLLRPGSSLVSTISQPAPGARPQLANAAILTVLDAPAPEGSFRPPYCGSDKRVRFARSQLKTELLAKLQPVGSMPPWPEVESWFERPWLDHVSIWAGNYLHPAQNMPNYGREVCDAVSTAALMLHLDVPDERKETLLVRFVQLGIDLWGVVQDGGSFSAAAGHMSGRKWPILFAGLLLDDAAMSAVGLDPALDFGEDGQTFYVEETPPGSGKWNSGNGGYGPALAGQADWGTAHVRQPWNDDADWFGDPYRLCCTANTWWGELLACYVMGAKPLWNHDALFDYQDRYLRENLKRGVTDWRLSWRPFYLDMWRAYRQEY